MGLNDIHSLSRSKWNCKYHVVFAPKHRRQVFHGEKKIAVGKILRKLCEWKGVNIIEAESCPDHVRMLLEIPPKMKVLAFIGCLKGKSAMMIYEQFRELKHKYRNREFRRKGHYVDTVGKNTKRIAEHIKHQLEEDKLVEQLSMPEVGPFKSRKRKQDHTQAADRLCVQCICEEQGLCPKVTNPAFDARLVFCFYKNN